MEKLFGLLLRLVPAGLFYRKMHKRYLQASAVPTQPMALSSQLVWVQPGTWQLSRGGYLGGVRS